MQVGVPAEWLAKLHCSIFLAELHEAGKLLGAPGIATRSKDVPGGLPALLLGARTLLGAKVDPGEQRRGSESQQLREIAAPIKLATGRVGTFQQAWGRYSQDGDIS